MFKAIEEYSTVNRIMVIFGTAIDSSYVVFRSFVAFLLDFLFPIACSSTEVNLIYIIKLQNSDESQFTWMSVLYICAGFRARRIDETDAEGSCNQQSHSL